MLPSGHVAGGYLVGIAFSELFLKEKNLELQNFFIVATIFFSFAPDLDSFWYFFKNRSFLVSAGNDKKNHRQYLSHAPVLWLLISLSFLLIPNSEYLKYLGFAILLGSWSHFILDSLNYGIMWFWPFSYKLYAFKNAGVNNIEVKEQKFFPHTIGFLKQYGQTITFIFEVIVILSAIIYYLNN